jgi:hypothetical protein
MSAGHLFPGTASGVQMYNHKRPERLPRVGSVSLPAGVEMMAMIIVSAKRRNQAARGSVAERDLAGRAGTLR